MPILAHTRLPAFGRLAAAGAPVVAPADWDGPLLHVGPVNTMADGALEATERQFLHLLAAALPGRGVLLHVAGLPEIPRGPDAARHCAAHYLTPAGLRCFPLDALIVTGANIADPDLDRLFFKDALADVIAWADATVPTTLFSCLATHAVLHWRHGRPRRPLAAKRWGLFPHRAAAPGHPLLAGYGPAPVVPHSRWNDVPADDFAGAGLQVLLVDADDGGVHLAASPDGRSVFMQGHPEYEPVSLLKEHKREVGRFAAGERADYPEVPAGIATEAGLAILAAHRARVVAGDPPPDYPEAAVLPHLHDTWRGDTERFFSAWLAPRPATAS